MSMMQPGANMIPGLGGLGGGLNGAAGIPGGLNAQGNWQSYILPQMWTGLANSNQGELIATQDTAAQTQASEASEKLMTGMSIRQTFMLSMQAACQMAQKTLANQAAASVSIAKQWQQIAQQAN